jgi:alkylation response protein AidB-like acyl-CoA dehydrogenase
MSAAEKLDPELESFRGEARAWLAENFPPSLKDKDVSMTAMAGITLSGDAKLWQERMGAKGWGTPTYPKKYGGGGLTNAQARVLMQEMNRIGAKNPIGGMGVMMFGPTLLEYGNEEQKARHVPGIVTAKVRWCQGYSEPNAGSDLGNVQCRAERDGDEWVLNGQKVWTSLATISDWCFVLCRTDPAAPKHQGISYLLVPMRQSGVEVRPIRQITGTSEFCEVFFDGARTSAENVVGEVNGGWQVAMGTLAFERGASTLGQQMAFEIELEHVIAAAKANGASADPVIRQRLADAWIGLRIMRFNALRTLTAVESGASLSREALITKLYWATWHRSLGKLAVDVLGARAELRPGGIGDYELDELQRLLLWTRADTIYAGTNQIQRNIIAERALGMPREPRIEARDAARTASKQP